MKLKPLAEAMLYALARPYLGPTAHRLPIGLHAKRGPILEADHYELVTTYRGIPVRLPR